VDWFLPGSSGDWETTSIATSERTVPVPVIPYRCGRCSKPLTKRWWRDTRRCADCVKNPAVTFQAPGVERVWALTTYLRNGRHPGSYLHKRAKDDKNLSEAIMETAATRFSAEDPWDYQEWTDRVVACPSSRERDFPRSHIMADTVASVLGQPMSDFLYREDSGDARSSTRGKDMPQSFNEVQSEVEVGCNAKLVAEENILLVDDTVTQGVTAASSAKVLRESGADEVRLLTFGKHETKTHLREYCD
jgi:predicted amidophosphoribosyltransferase